MKEPKAPSGSSDEEIAAFSSLYHDLSGDVLSYLLRTTPTPEDAADCVAEVFLIAWSKRDEIPDDARSWLFGVARNVMRRGRERDARSQHTSAALAQEIRSSLTWSEQPTPDEKLLRALAKLSPLDQEILTLSSWDGLSPREVARVLGLSANVVRVRLHRGRAKLRSNLTIPADEPEERDQDRPVPQATR